MRSAWKVRVAGSMPGLTRTPAVRTTSRSWAVVTTGAEARRSTTRRAMRRDARSSPVATATAEKP